MKTYATEIKAVCPKTGDLKTYGGPNVPGISVDTANDYCQNNGLGYCKVLAQLIEEIPCKPGTFDAAFDKSVNYDNINSN